MRHSKILFASLPVLLAGCLDMFDNDSNDYYTQPTPPAPVSIQPAPGSAATPSGQVPPASSTMGCGCPGKPAQPVMIPSEALPPSSSSASDAEWNPNEGQLVRAGDLVMELQSKNGGVRPSHAAMATHIRTHMGLTAAQAEKVLEEMGL